MNSDGCGVTHWHRFAFLKTAAILSFCPTFEPLHYLFPTCVRSLTQPLGWLASRVCPNRINWLWWCRWWSGVKPKRIAEIETDWEALGGLLGMMEERGGAAAGVIRARMLCAAAPMWCSQQQPAPLCVCLHIQIHAAQGDVMPVRICM